MEAAEDEIEALCSIWEGVRVEKSVSSLTISHKIKCLEDEATSASVLLECHIPERYPSVNPIVKLSNPRGISEPEFRELCRIVEQRVEENSVDEIPVICEIFQTCSDYLSEHQHINMDCSICLLLLSDSPIIVTSCDHFMHCSCFCKYLTECSRRFRREIDEQKRTQPHVKCRVDTNILCPVCRESMTHYDSEHDNTDFERVIQKMIRESKKNQKTLTNVRRRSSCTTEDVKNTIRRSLNVLFEYGFN
uniref:RWD domain-containing protein n=1 Tax=Caenorhabditis japonica TaxID=281687 RepID=A0A8R1HWP2_CAEJA